MYVVSCAAVVKSAVYHCLVRLFYNLLTATRGASRRPSASAEPLYVVVADELPAEVSFDDALLPRCRRHRQHRRAFLFSPHRTHSIDADCFCVSVCVLITTVSPAKTAEPIDLPFGLLARGTLY